MPMKPRAVAFDIIGTTFSLEPLRPRLADLGLPALALELVYATALRDAFALACCNDFAPFATLLGHALDEVLALAVVEAAAAGKAAVLDEMGALPAYPDAAAAFATLGRAGIAVVALSNGAAARTGALLERAGLAAEVRLVLSVDDVRLSKPRPDVYAYAASSCGLRPGELAMVATHPWDLRGAKAAGLTTGYVARGVPFPPALGAPDVSGPTLLAVAEALAAL